jgi:sugar O-acyltransferase (sialic acid O-acetyltransferase NeuD family)
MLKSEVRAPVVLVGAGGFSRETAETIRACIDAGAPWQLHGFLDDDPAREGATVDGLPVLGPIDSISEHPDALVVVGTGRPDNYTSRLSIVTRLGLPDERYARIVHPAATLAASTSIGAGSVVLAGVVATTSVQIGNHVGIMPGAVLTHDDVLDDYVTVAAGVRLGGNVHVETGAYIGSGAMVREGVTIGAWSMIGMGSVVTRDVPPGQLWFGSPARCRRDAPVPADFLARELR